MALGDSFAIFGPGRSECVGADNLARLDRVDRDPGLGIDRVLDEPDRAVAQEDVDPPGVPAPRPGEGGHVFGAGRAREAVARVARTERGLEVVADKPGI